MNWLLIYVLLALCLWLIVGRMGRPGGIYEYPFFAGAAFLGFVLPQLPALANDPFLPPGAFAKTALVTILSTAACGLGWAVAKRPMTSLSWTFDERRLLWVAVLLSLAGAFFFFKISRLPKELTAQTQWTGLPVAYLFLASVMNYGYATAALCFARRPSGFALSIILFDLMFYMDRIVISGRRSAAVELVLVTALAVWFQRGIAIPRLAAPIGILVGALAITSTGSYRTIAHDHDGPQWSEVMNIDVWGNFADQLDRGGPEMRNAVQRIHFVDQSMNFDYGIWHWNSLVFNFVPAQIVGSAFKESLTIPHEGRQFSPDYESQVLTGSTDTGIADAFASLWYFGALKFFLIAYLLARIYRAAAAGNAACQIIYGLSVTPAMTAITHDTQWILSAWVHMALLFLPFLALARVRKPLPRAPSPGHPWHRVAPAQASASLRAQRSGAD